MDNGYLILEDGEQTGPFTLEEVIEKEPDLHTRILSPNETAWKDACDLPELYEYFLSLGVDFPTEDNLASFWIRLLAFVIDMFLLSIVINIIMAVLTPNSILSSIQKYNSLEAFSKMPANQLLILQITVNSILIVYNMICEASPMRGSVGKRICRLAVVDADGQGLTILNALVRSFGRVVSLFFWGIGFISIFFTEHKQALHDLVAKTYVIRRNV